MEQTLTKLELLPPEILLRIGSYLETAESLCLSLVSRTCWKKIGAEPLHRLNTYGPRTREEASADKHLQSLANSAFWAQVQRRQFLLLLQRDLPCQIFCFYCQKLHALDSRVTNIGMVPRCFIRHDSSTGAKPLPSWFYCGYCEVVYETFPRGHELNKARPCLLNLDPSLGRVSGFAFWHTQVSLKRSHVRLLIDQSRSSKEETLECLRSAFWVTTKHCKKCLDVLIFGGRRYVREVLTCNISLISKTRNGTAHVTQCAHHTWTVNTATRRLFAQDVGQLEEQERTLFRCKICRTEAKASVSRDQIHFKIWKDAGECTMPYDPFLSVSGCIDEFACLRDEALNYPIGVDLLWPPAETLRESSSEIKVLFEDCLKSCQIYEAEQDSRNNGDFAQ